jgi:N utilization substance protein A
LRRLLELEVPEIFIGTVEIKAVAREAGFRSKVAVAAKQEGVDAVGCCVGLRGIRIQNIVSELGGEKIDVVNWNADPAIFIANALSPSQVVAVRVDEKRESAIAVIPDRMLSLAIGKEGQNVRLAVKLTGWRIDIKSASDAEKEKAEIEAEKAAKDAAEKPELVEEPEAVVAVTPAPVLAGAGAAAPAKASAAKGLRFAEDLNIPPIVTPEAAAKDKKKKKKTGKESAEDGIRLKKARRGGDMYDTDDEA